MADKELIIGLLEKVNRRVRSERRLKSISQGLSISFIIPVVFKLIDLVSPFRGITVATFLAVWGIASVFWIIWNVRGHETLTGAAASLDRLAKLQDQMKTAYWFIGHPSPSEWVKVQILAASKVAERLKIEKLYPGSIPRGLYKASALVTLFVILNFLPQSLNHNWLHLEGAPPFRLSSTDRALVEQAKKLLDKTEAAGQLEKIINDLQQGTITSDTAQQQLSELRHEIDGGNLELHNILDGLTSMSNELEQSSALSEIAQALSEGDPAKAAEAIRNLAEQLGGTPADVLRELQKTLAQAAVNSPAALEELSKLMQQASDALKGDDPQAGKAALDDLAKALEQLAEKMSGQQQQSQASEQLAELQNSLQQEGAISDTASGGGGDQAPNGEPTSGASSGSGQGSSSAVPSGTAGSESQEEFKQVETTKLEVQLKKESLKGQAAKGEQVQDEEEASKQERSAMDYRNVPSQLSPAQKDALNQNRLPREQREIVKNYFEEIRPQSTKPIKQ